MGWCSTGDAGEKFCSLMRVSGSVMSLGVSTVCTTSQTIWLYSAGLLAVDHEMMPLETAEDIY